MSGVINSLNLRKMNAVVLAGFQTGVESGNAGVTRLAPELYLEQDAIGEEEAKVPWLSGSGRLKEWNGPQERQKLAINQLVVTPGRYSLLLSLTCSEVENNNLKRAIAAAKMFGADASDHFEELCADTLVSGFSVEPPDGSGTTFFANSRKVAPDMSDSATYDNLIAGALSASTFAEARQKLRNMTDAHGNKLNFGARGFRLIVAGNLEGTANSIVNADNVASGGVSVSNVWKGMAKAEVWNWLPDNYWFLQAITPSVGRRPLVRVNFSKMRTRYTDENDMPAIDLDEIWWQVYSRHKVELGDAQTIMGSTGS